ncbi:MAG: SAM-dependent methyltransferase, partial [Actinobacteria bacterium]|nr:SAM-dependent methyltransferase [Actinomycetota bacterium]MCG2789238.1 SAM-dependent methyltransferase [Actinomycetes bacterium]
IQVWKLIKLINKDMTHKDKDGLKGWIRTTWFPYTNRVPENLRNLFIDEIINNYIEKHSLDANGCTHVKMVRLEVMAEKL